MAQSPTERPLQIIEGQRLDPHRLVRLLENVYGTPVGGENKFRVEVRKFALT